MVLGHFLLSLSIPISELHYQNGKLLSFWLKETLPLGWFESSSPRGLTNGLLVWQGHPRLWKGNTDTCLRGCKDSELICIEGLAQKRWSQRTPALSSPCNHFRWSSQSPTGNYLEVVTCEPSLTRVHEVGPWSKTTLHENNWNGQLHLVHRMHPHYIRELKIKWNEQLATG